MTIDPFTPWHEPGEALRERTVERDDAVSWLLSACEAFLAGEHPTWCLVVGPRGSGKSHLLQLARTGLSDPNAVRWIGEDAAAGSDPDALWARIWRDDDPWGWTEPAPEPSGPRILFVEGLDRLLAGLRPDGRWALRHHLQESGAFLVGTALSAHLAAASGEAFFGQLDTWALEPLSLDAARTLFSRVSGEVDRAPRPLTLTRREALIRMSGGSPRAVIVLAEAVRGTEGDALGAAEGLLHAVQRLVTHYQQRFHDLPPLGQRVVELLARAPRELTAGEVQQHAGASSAAVSATARALEDAGVLRRHSEGEDARVSHYALAEPLFRYWLEYRTMPSWESTRTAWLGRLLGEVLTREELVDVWWGTPNEEIREAAARVGPDKLFKRAWTALLDARDPPELEHALERALTVASDEIDRAWLAVSLIHARRTDLLDRLSPWVEHDATVRGLLAFVRRIAEPVKTRKAPFVDLLKALRPGTWELNAASEAVRLLLDGVDPRGAPWRLTAKEQDLLAAVPFMRARFAVEGRRVTDPPLLEWNRLRAVNVETWTPDVRELLAVAHQQRDTGLFSRAASALAQRGAPNRRLPECPRPALVAPAPDLLAPLLIDQQHDALTWAASLAEQSDAVFAAALEQARTWSAPTTEPLLAEVSALLALVVRSRERFDALARALDGHPSIAAASRTFNQLQERAHGRLQPELEEVWRAISPRTDGE